MNITSVPAWELSSVLMAPVLHCPLGELGHLVFNPVPESNTVLFDSASLFPPNTQPPHLIPSRFLEISSPSSSLPPSVASSTASYLGPYVSSPSSTFSRNRLQLLQCPNNVVLIFFVTGDNFDQVGYLVLSVERSIFKASGSGTGNVITASKSFNHPIILLLVEQVADSGSGACALMGYMMACTKYSVHCFKILFGNLGLGVGRPVIEYTGGKTFRSCGIVHACFSPHIPGESVVLLENGELFLFEMDADQFIARRKYKSTSLKVSWGDYVECDKVGWLSCGYSWHPRIFIVARFDGVFLLDLRHEECNVVCLAKNEILHFGLTSEDDIIAFSTVCSNGFIFFVATNKWLLYYDIRMPLIPKMRWMHGIKEPCFVEVLSLSDLINEKHKWSSETGFCIIIGSFWNCEFGCFCYVPPAFDVSRSSGCLCECRIPFDLALSGCNRLCGNCLIRNDFSRNALPAWVDWQEKTEIVVGFGILAKDMELLDETDSLGGFLLIRLMSSGKLELQKYCAAQLTQKACQGTSISKFGESLLFSRGSDEYKSPRRFKHMKFAFLDTHLNNNLMEYMGSKIRQASKPSSAAGLCNAEIHDIILEKLRAFANEERGLASVDLGLLGDVSFLSSIHEVVCMKLWAGLPVDLLVLAFSYYSEILEVLVDKKKSSLEFLSVPDQLQLPPFFLRRPSRRSNKWSQKVPHSNGLVGPVLSLPALLAFLVFRENKFPNSENEELRSQEMDIKYQCNQVVQELKKICVCNTDSEEKREFISLVDHKDETWDASQKAKPLVLHKPIALLDGSEADDMMEIYGTFIFSSAPKSPPGVAAEGVQLEGSSLFDDTCPVKLKFDSDNYSFGKEELESYKLLKKQFLKWQEGLPLYEKFSRHSTETGS